MQSKDAALRLRRRARDARPLHELRLSIHVVMTSDNVSRRYLIGVVIFVCVFWIYVATTFLLVAR